MDINKIITTFYQDRNLNDALKKIASSDNEDIKQELFYILLKKPASLIVDLYKNNTLLYYSVRIIINICAKRLRDKKHTLPPSDFNTRPDYYESGNEFIEAFNSMQLNNGFPYHRSLIELIVKFGSQSEVSRQTGIPINSVNKSVKEVRRYIKSKL